MKNKCSNCAFYECTSRKKDFGLCNIQLPPWIDVAAVPGGKTKANIVSPGDGCDLHKPKPEDDEL